MPDFKQKIINASIGAGVGAIIGAAVALRMTDQTTTDQTITGTTMPDGNAVIVGEHVVKDPDLRDLLLELANTRSAAPLVYKDIVRQFNDLIQLAEYVEGNEVTGIHMMKGNRIATMTKQSLGSYKRALATDARAMEEFNELESKLNAAVDDRIQNIVTDVSAKM